MNVVLHPRFADQPGKLRVWIGVTGGSAAPPLAWQLNGAPVDPKPVRAIASARTPALLHGNPPRAFTGLYEFDALGPATHRVSVQAGALTASATVRKFSDALPVSLDQWFNVLCVSCYYRDEARPGALAATLDRVRKKAAPHMTVLMGDQVYLDLPTIKDFDDDSAFLAAKFEADYVKNWMVSPGFADILGMAPSVCIPDDHEYWNNAPHPATVIQNSWREASRDRWRGAARAMFAAFQAPSPDSVARPYEIDVSPLSFLFADGRSDRMSDRSRAFAPVALTRIGEWVEKLNQRSLLGVFVTGQPVLDKPVGRLAGRIADWALANYGDHRALLDTLSKCKQPLVLLTGDVHWSRTAHAKRAAGKLCDVVVSPAALVETAGGDQVRTSWNWVRELVHRGQRWPRHSSPDAAPRGVNFGPGPRLDFTTSFEGQGDQIAVLQFRNHGGKVHAKAHYWHIQSEAETPRTVELLP